MGGEPRVIQDFQPSLAKADQSVGPQPLQDPIEVNGG
jgi:hypothetical protein